MRSNPAVSQSTALARPGDVEPWRSPDWQQLWLASQARPWRSLALLPAAAGAPAELLLESAVTLARTGMLHLGAPIHVADATSLTLAQLVQFSDEVAYYKAKDAMVLLALPALSENVTAITLAQAADSCLLLVLLGKMSATEAKKTVDRVGAARFLGSAVLKPGGAK